MRVLQSRTKTTAGPSVLGDENDEIGRHGALDVLLEVMLACEAQMVLEDLRGGAASQIVNHVSSSSLIHRSCVVFSHIR